MDNAQQKKRAYTKSRLIKELAFRAGISQRQSREALEAIIEIAYREAKENCFIMPGLCKFDVVRRAARNIRNPATGAQLVLPERDALRVTLSKRAKDAVAPKVTPLTPEEYAALTAQKAEMPAEEKPSAEENLNLQPAEEAKPAEQEQAAQEKPMEQANPTEEEKVDTQPEKSADGDFMEVPEIKGDNAISFKCTTCGQEIIAPGEAVGYEAECPACGAILLVPNVSEPGTTYAQGGESGNKTIISASEIDDMEPSALKNRTIRIDALFDDDDKPTQPSDNVPDAQKSRTMRIDLPDEF